MDMTNMTMANSNNDDNSRGMSGMVFSQWNSYKLHLLFSTYDIKQPWQFALTFFLVILAATFFHVLSCCLSFVENLMVIQLKAHLEKKESDTRPHGWVMVKILVGLLSGLKYCWGIMLMLVAMMSMNPNLFLALGIGYALGAYLFCDYEISEKFSRGSSIRNHGKLVTQTLAWWNKHSAQDIFILFAGMMTFPLALFSTYALIDYTCLSNGRSTDDDRLLTTGKGPYPGAFPIDTCYLEDRTIEKISLKTSFAVYYIFLFLTSILMYFTYRNKATFNFVHKEIIRGFKVTNGELIVFSAITALLVFNAVFWWRIYGDLVDRNFDPANPRTSWYYATQVTGRLCDVSLGLLMIPVAKNSVLQLLLGISYDSAIGFHKLMGWWFVIISVVHAGVYIESTVLDPSESVISHLFSIPDPKYSNKLVYDDDYHLMWGPMGNWMASMGFYGTIFMAFPVLFSLPQLRKYCYNLFYYLHLSLQIGVVFLWLHSASDFYYMLPSIGLYAADLAVRLYHRFNPSKVKNIIREDGPGGLMRIDIDVTSNISLQQYECGQFVRICFPSLNSFEWHTYTLAGPFGNTATIYLNPHAVDRPQKSWLKNKFDWTTATNKKLAAGMSVSVDGPFGRGISFDHSAMASILCFIGGSGISCGLNIAHSITGKAQESAIIPLIHLVWSVRSQTEGLALFSGLSDLPPTVKVTIHLTGVDQATFEKCYSATELNVQFGQIPFEKYLNASVDTGKKGKYGVVICGPVSFTSDAYKVTSQFAQRTNEEIFVDCEKFEL